LVLFCFKHTSTFISIFCTFLLKQYELEWCSKKTYCKQTPLFKFKGTMTKWPVDKHSHIAQYETRKSTRRNRHIHKQTQIKTLINSQKQVQHMSEHPLWGHLLFGNSFLTKKKYSRDDVWIVYRWISLIQSNM